MKYVHLEARTNVDIPTHLGKSQIMKYEPDNPLHDPTIVKTLYSIYGKREDGMWVCILDAYEYPVAYRAIRTMSDLFQAPYTDSNLIDVDPKDANHA